MVINLILFSLIITVVCGRCPSGKFGEHCEQFCTFPHCFCNTHLDCLSCAVGYFDTSNYCMMTCITPTCTCTNRFNCHSCQDGYYGLENNCKQNCSSRCDGTACYNDGTCDTCKPNFTGSTCNSCVEGRYGVNCSLQCSRGCEGDICNLSDGTCNCSSNYSGDKCEHCIGDECSQTCSPGCLDNTCSFIDRKCKCKDLYTGGKCVVCIEGRYGEHCLETSEKSEPTTTDKPNVGAAVGAAVGVAIGAIILVVAVVVVVIIFKRRLLQRETQDHNDEQDTTYSEGKATQPGQYETLSNSSMVDNHRSDTYTSLVGTRQAEMTEGISPVIITMNIVGGSIAQPGPYETLNATHLKERYRNDTYTMLLVSGEAGVTERCNSESIQINHPTKNPGCHSYENL